MRAAFQAASDARNALLQRIEELQSDLDHNFADTERFNRLRAEADSRANVHQQAIDELEKSIEQLEKKIEKLRKHIEALIARKQSNKRLLEEEAREKAAMAEELAKLIAKHNDMNDSLKRKRHLAFEETRDRHRVYRKVRYIGPQRQPRKLMPSCRIGFPNCSPEWNPPVDRARLCACRDRQWKHR